MTISSMWMHLWFSILTLLLWMGCCPCSMLMTSVAAAAVATVEMTVTADGSTVDEAEDPSPPGSNCRLWTGALECGWEPQLQPMEVKGFHATTDGDDDTVLFYAYVPPDVATFYNETAGKSKRKLQLWCKQ